MGVVTTSGVAMATVVATPHSQSSGLRHGDWFPW